MIGSSLTELLLVAAIAAPAIESGAVRVVKLYGAGGRGRIEAYATGLLVSPNGHVVTVFSAMLSTDEIIAVSADGSRHKAALVAVDPVRELALLKTDRASSEHFRLGATRETKPARRVLVFSNAFNVASGAEPVSVQQGVIAGRLDPDPAVHPFPFPVYLLDATVNNPGSAGGAVVDAKGDLIGMVGKEFRDRGRNVWLQYAVPVDELADFIQRSLRGETVERGTAAAPTSHPFPPVDSRGLRLVANILDRTPAFVDGVDPGSPADEAGLRPDDLVVHVGNRVVRSVTEAREALAQVPLDKPLRLVILRNDRLVTIEVAGRQRGGEKP